MRAPHVEHGIALITAMLVVSLVTIAAVAMASRQQVDIRRSANLLQSDQAYLYALGLEDWAAQLLRRDKANGPISHLDEDWATVLPPIPVDGGQITGSIEDLLGRFNLNNLVESGQKSARDFERFERLLNTLQLPPELAPAVVDWLDLDINVTFPGGAEDAEYLGRELPYRAANRLMADPSELLLVAGFDQAVYQKLAPYVSALPERTDINLNTAPATVLTVLAQGTTLTDAEALVQARENKPFQSVNDCLAQPVLAGRATDSQGLSVESDYFLAHGAVNIGRIIMDFYSVLKRDSSGSATVIRRGQGAYGE